MSRVCQSDASFGPGIGSCRGGFDFSLTFEESILGIIPQAAILLLVPLRLATLQRRRDRVAKDSHLGFLKMITSSCYAITSIVLLAIWSETNFYKTKLSIASASVEFFASLVIVVLSRMEHIKAVRPSHLLQFFLLVLLLCNAVRLRTLFLMDYSTSLVTSASIHTFLTGFFLLLESLDKRALFNSQDDQRLSPEETVGLFGKRLFWYLNGFFQEGYRKVLKPDDLINVDADLASKHRDTLFQSVWTKQDKFNKRPLLRTIVRVLWADLLLPVMPRLVQMATTLSQPYLISAMIKFTQARDNAANRNNGYGIIAAFALNYTLLAISSSWCAQSVARFATKLRSCLISLIYEKTLHIASKDVDLGSATVLMNVDVEKLVKFVQYMHEFWATLISVSVALYILYSHLGIAFTAPFLTTLITTGICTWIGKYMGPCMGVWAAATEQRVTAIVYATSNTKEVRMLGLSDFVLKMLTCLREQEVEAHRHIRKLMVWILTISNVIFQITSVATYVTFIVIVLVKSNGAALNYNVLYGSLSALKLVTSPLIRVLQLIPMLQTGLASLERIQQFLLGGSLGHEEEEHAAAQPANAEDIELFPLRSQTPSMDHDLTAPVFAMKDATFEVDEKPLLTNINLKVSKRTFVMIIGSVGSGKSILLRSIVGETTLVTGSFNPPSSGVAFCSQLVWLRNTSVRDNIIGEDEFEDSWYNSVVWSCGLLRDFAEMKRGDKTSIGSKGISLSGGQKNRIALARALYARKPVFLIDDMIAGLDNTTEKLVFDRVFGTNGLLRRMGVTVLLATHATHFARHADRILVISAGRLVEDATYQELIDRGNVNPHIFGDTADIQQHETGVKDDSEPPQSEKIITAILDQVEEEDASRQAGDSRSLLFFLRAVGPIHTALYFGLLAVTTVATTIQFLWLKWWAQSNDPSRSATIRNLYLFVIITVANIILYFIWIAHYALWFIPRSSLALHATQLDALMCAKFSYIVSTDVGVITNIFSQDINMVDTELQNSWLNFTSGFLEIIASIVIIVVATPPVAATLPLLGAVGYMIQRVYLRTSRQVRIMDLEAKAPLCTHFLESLAGVVTIRCFGWLSAYREKNNRFLLRSQVPFYMLFAIQNWLSLVLELVVAGLITCIVGLAVGLRSKVDTGYLGLALVAAMDLGFNFRMIIRAWTDLETSLSAVTRIRQFSQSPSEDQDTTKPDPPESWPKNGSVQFKQIVASYTEGGTPVLSNVNLDIKAGEKIGLAGRTGSGKSSFVATLFGLLHQQNGAILIDNIPTSDISLSRLRSVIVALPQEPFFLKGNVRHNLAPWMPGDNRPSVSDAQMKDALEQVQLWDKLRAATVAEQSALDLNLDNVESLLSQGERQLFCLARAILMDGKIVVLDEATSSVDAKTDALMQRILRTAFADRTIIAIAHRLDTILDFDRVVVMDSGKIVEVGPPTVLMQTDGSLFKDLMESQEKK